jgi:crotonobetainyl-CoA:carnitine CoA-transferase CaiB-like acyl-CoA transferase
VVSHPPRHGEHTTAVLRELGYRDAQIEDLRKKGIV